MDPTLSEGRAVLIEQVDLESGIGLRLWDSVSAAARALDIPMHGISSALKGAREGATAGGFRWRMLKTRDADSEEAEVGAEDTWRLKLHKKSKDYRSGGELRDYQIACRLNWLLKCWYTKRSSILADEMGLGKTVQVVAFLEHLFDTEGIKGPFLVAVPLSTIEHWRRESEAWTVMSVCLYHDTGGGRELRDVIREFEWYYKSRSRRLLKFHLLITTYDDLIRDYEELAEIPWRVVVVDEAHRLRNTNSKLLECMRSVVSKGQLMYGYQHRILMTGTPLQNNTAELWSLLNFIEPAKFPDAEKFAERFGNIQTQEQVEGLQRRIAPHILRRVKEDVAKDIPPKEETIIDVELTTMQKQYYRAIFEHNHGFLAQGTKTGGLPKLMNIQMELRKCCNHPFLINGVEEKEMEDLDNALKSESEAARRSGRAFDALQFKKEHIESFLVQTSGKMVLIDKLLPKLKKEGHKVLIFSQMVKMIDLIDEFCEFRGYSCERLDGRVSGNDRQKSIDRFNKNEDSFVFLLSTRAGGVGINLTAADTVIIFDSDWNPQNDVQAMARCHRIGQSKSVTIYRLITRKSFEAEMFERASRKLGLEQAVLGSRMFDAEDMEETNKGNAKMDGKELEQLLREGAYAVLLEDNNEDIKTFCEQDIESILDQRTHVIREESKVEASSNKKKAVTRKSMFTGESSLEFAEIDVNDPDFWKKVLPDLVTPDSMLQRLSDPGLTANDDDDDEPLGDVSSAAGKFMRDIAQMMEGMLDLQRRGQLPERERGICIKLLLRITLKEQTFSSAQRAQAQEWLSIVEGTRSRRARQDMYLPEQAPELRKGEKRRGRKPGSKNVSFAKDLRKRRRGEEEEGEGDGEIEELEDEGEVEDGGSVEEDDEDDEEDGRRRPKGSKRKGDPDSDPPKKRIRRTKEELLADKNFKSKSAKFAKQLEAVRSGKAVVGGGAKIRMLNEEDDSEDQTSSPAPIKSSKKGKGKKGASTSTPEGGEELGEDSAPKVKVKRQYKKRKLSKKAAEEAEAEGQESTGGNQATESEILKLQRQLMEGRSGRAGDKSPSEVEEISEDEDERSIQQQRYDDEIDDEELDEVYDHPV